MNTHLRRITNFNDFKFNRYSYVYDNVFAWVSDSDLNDGSCGFTTIYIFFFFLYTFFPPEDFVRNLNTSIVFPVANLVFLVLKKKKKNHFFGIPIRCFTRCKKNDENTKNTILSNSSSLISILFMLISRLPRQQ